MKLKTALFTILTLATSSTFAQEDYLPGFKQEPIKVNNMEDFLYIELLYLQLREALAERNWYRNQYEKNTKINPYSICINIQKYQNQKAFYYANKDVIDAHNKLGKIEFDLQTNINELNEMIKQERQPLGSNTCINIAKQFE